MATTATTGSESDRLQAKCLQTLKEERKADLQLDDLKSRIQKLRRRGHAFDEHSQKKKEDTTSAFYEFAKHSCLEFCKKVQSSFPREVRDIIYGYLTGTGDVTVTHSYHKRNRPRAQRIDYFETSSEAQFRCRSMDADVDHWWMAKFVGVEMLREMGENYYRSARFKFESNLTEVAKFRVTDQWQLGFLPVSFVSNVEVTVKCTEYTLEGLDFPFSDSDYDDDPVASQGNLWGPVSQQHLRDPLPSLSRSGSSLLLELESLFGLKCGCTITIRLRMADSIDMQALKRQEWMCDTIAPFIFPTVDRLKNAGYRVRIAAFGGEVWYGPHLFISSCNPDSSDALKKEYKEYAKEEQERIDDLKAKFDAEKDPWGYGNWGNED